MLQWENLVLELVSSSKCTFPSPPTESENWQLVLSRAETGSIPGTNSFDSCWDFPDNTPLWPD